MSRRFVEPGRREAHRVGLRFFALGLTVPPPPHTRRALDGDPTTAPTSPKPHTPADLTVSKDACTTLDNKAPDAGLRTALTEFADEWAGWTEENSCDDMRTLLAGIRALLAAHPAPETARSGHGGTREWRRHAKVVIARRRLEA